MAYQKVTTTSYGGRLKNALSGVLMGFVMLIGSVILLFWNEGRTIKTTKMLKEAQKVCTELGDISEVNADMDHMMVHATGQATTEDILTDDEFDLSINAIKLIRDAEYYQWVEHQETKTRDKVGGGQETITTYTYSKEWVDEPVDSDKFEDPEYRGIDNSVPAEFDDFTIQAENVAFGAYRLPKDLVSQMSDDRTLPLELSNEVTKFYNNEMHKVLPDAAKDQQLFHVKGNMVYLGENTSRPHVGDVRITYRQVLPGEVSILAKVNGDTFEEFTAKNSYSFMALEDGAVSMENMFENQHANNRALAWLLRIIGVLLAIFGFRNIFGIITSLLKVLPFLANIADLGVGLVSIVLGLALSLVVIAVGWLFYRPLLGILLLAVAGVLIYFLGKRSKEKHAAKLAAEAAATPVE